MKTGFKRTLTALLLIFALAIALTGCTALDNLHDIAALLPGESPAVSERDNAYTSKDDVSTYLLLYGELPSNYITKSEARAMGWPGGDLWAYADGMRIGGDRFGNREGLLPEDDIYYECDINYHGGARGVERLIYCQDIEHIYYTDDHYASFEQIYP